MATLLVSFLDSLQRTCCWKAHWQDASSLQNDLSLCASVTLCSLWGIIWTFLEIIVWPLAPPFLEEGCPSSRLLRLVFRILERLLMYVCVCLCVYVLSHVQRSSTPWTVAHQVPLSWNLPSKNTREGCHFLLQGILPTQGLNTYLLRLLHWYVDSLPLHHLGSPRLWIMVTSRVERPRTLLCSQAVYLAIHVPSILSHESLSKFLIQFVP